MQCYNAWCEVLTLPPEAKTVEFLKTVHSEGQLPANMAQSIGCPNRVFMIQDTGECGMHAGSTELIGA